MIVAPLNDRACLDKLTELAADGVHRESVQQLAARFATTKQLVQALRMRPQREDAGNPLDGPKVACDVPQRARINPADPNCVERSITYAAAAELIDPRPIRQLATVEIPGIGRHTFPLEDGRPVILDPLVTRNMLDAGLYLIRQAQGAKEEPLSPEELIDWVAGLADDEAGRYRNGRARMHSALGAIDAVLAGRPVSATATRNLSWALALAERAAPMFGQRGVDGVKLASATLAQLARRNVSIQFGKYKLAPSWKALGQTLLFGAGAATRVGKAAVPIAAKALAAKYGIPPEVADAVVAELGPRPAASTGGVTPKPGLVRLLVEHPALLDKPKLLALLSAAARTNDGARTARAANPRGRR